MAKPALSSTGLFGTHPRKRLRLAIAVVLSFLSVGPLIYMFLLSFQSNNDIQGDTVVIPTHLTTSNYVQAWTDNSFGHYFANSIFVALGTVVVTVSLASLAAFAFARISSLAES